MSELGSQVESRILPNLYSRSPKVGNPIASILKNNVLGLPALFGLNPVSNFMGFTVYLSGGPLLWRAGTAPLHPGAEQWNKSAWIPHALKVTICRAEATAANTTRAKKSGNK